MLIYLLTILDFDFCCHPYNYYRDSNKSPETKFNKVYAHISKTEQAFEITITPALYH